MTVGTSKKCTTIASNTKRKQGLGPRKVTFGVLIGVDIVTICLLPSIHHTVRNRIGGNRVESIVIYFSQTGNTEKVAKAIRSGIESVTGQCDIVKLRDADLGSLAKYDLIGLGCPVFAFKEPENVTAFIKRMAKAMVLGRHCFVFATHGGHPGNVLPSMTSKLERVGLKVIGGFDTDGHLYLPFYTTPWFTDGHPDNIDLKQAADFGAEMARKQRETV